MSDIKFRGYDEETEEMHYSSIEEDCNDAPIVWEIDTDGVYFEKLEMYNREVGGEHEQGLKYNRPNQKIDLYIGLKDKKDKDYFIGDIGKFDNGDTFILKVEDFLEVYIDWIGEAECEDQAKDLYRISMAEIIGNIHKNPELLI